MKVTYVGPFPEVELYDTGDWVNQGETIDVRDSLAGRPPSGEPGTDDYDPGEGLLAQTANWQPVDGKPKAKPKPKASVRDSGGITEGGDGE